MEYLYVYKYRPKSLKDITYQESSHVLQSIVKNHNTPNIIIWSKRFWEKLCYTLSYMIYILKLGQETYNY